MEMPFKLSFDPREFNLTYDPVTEMTLWRIRTAKDIVFTIGASLLIIIGIPGNILTIIVMRTPAMRDGLFSTYLMSLCFWNLMVIVWAVPRFIVDIYLQREVLFENESFCGFYRVLVMALLCVANWHVVVITGVRLCFVLDRSRKYYEIYGSPCMTLCFIITLVLLFVLPLARSMVRYTDEDGSPVECFVNPDAKTWLPTLILISGLPCFLIISCNLWLLYLHKGSRLGMIKNETTTRARHQLVLLVTLSGAQYLFTYLPYLVVFPNLPEFFDMENPVGQAKARLCYGIVLLIVFSNNGTNFLLYAFCGKRFRKTLWKLLNNWLCFGKMTIQVSVTQTELTTDTKGRVSLSPRQRLSTSFREPQLKTSKSKNPVTQRSYDLISLDGIIPHLFKLTHTHSSEGGSTASQVETQV